MTGKKKFLAIVAVCLIALATSMPLVASPTAASDDPNGGYTPPPPPPPPDPDDPNLRAAIGRSVVVQPVSDRLTPKPIHRIQSDSSFGSSLGDWLLSLFKFQG